MDLPNQTSGDAVCFVKLGKERCVNSWVIENLLEVTEKWMEDSERRC